MVAEAAKPKGAGKLGMSSCLFCTFFEEGKGQRQRKGLRLHVFWMGLEYDAAWRDLLGWMAVLGGALPLDPICHASLSRRV